MSNGNNEAFSRVLIDKALEFSGWDLLDLKQVSFEVIGNDGRADYVLSGTRGPLSVLEAKREAEDPYDAKEQARGYAENLNAPFVILSNGREHWFGNYTRKDQNAYRIERLPSRADLERLRYKNLQPPRPLLSEVIGADFCQAKLPFVSSAALAFNLREPRPRRRNADDNLERAAEEAKAAKVKKPKTSRAKREEEML